VNDRAGSDTTAGREQRGGKTSICGPAFWNRTPGSRRIRSVATAALRAASPRFGRLLSQATGSGERRRPSWGREGWRAWWRWTRRRLSMSTSPTCRPWRQPCHGLLWRSAPIRAARRGSRR